MWVRVPIWEFFYLRRQFASSVDPAPFLSFLVAFTTLSRKSFWYSKGCIQALKLCSQNTSYKSTKNTKWCSIKHNGFDFYAILCGIFSEWCILLTSEMKNSALVFPTSKREILRAYATWVDLRACSCIAKRMLRATRGRDSKTDPTTFCPAQNLPHNILRLGLLR